ncbi:MAG: hypothetical protein CBC83_08010 [Flavobacteriales bacterium TMED123]|nr:MAG: hypothetical protein CBC83_08010 [Flavobacteriales bacterium TMED123]|tara:strand:- start:797 stop:1243 length:447 start_codon:yes stop_codon:yes gene_type:complete
MESTTRKNKNVHHRWRSRAYVSLCYLGIALGVIGCGTIKKAGVVATGAAVGATAGSVLSGGAIAPIAGAMTTAFVTDVATSTMDNVGGRKLDMDCAPDNFWSLLGSLAEMGGWLLILVVIIPMVLGWFLPGPVKLKGREPKSNNPYIR